MIFYLLQDVQSFQIPEIIVGISTEHLVVEAFDIESDYQIISLQAFNESVDLVFHEIDETILF